MNSNLLSHDNIIMLVCFVTLSMTGTLVLGIMITEASAEIMMKNTITNNVIPHSYNVSIVKGSSFLGDKSYSPNPINVSTTEAVRWINNDGTSHTVTSDSLYIVLGPGQISEPVKFNQTEIIQYFCTFHPSMNGQIVVSPQ